MRVAYVCADPGVPVFGTKGASVHVQEVLRVLVARGDEVHLFCHRTGGVPDETLAPVRVYPLEALRTVGPFDLVYERYSLWSRAGMAYAKELGVPGVLEVNAPLIEEQAKYRELVDRDEALAVVRDAAADASVITAVSEPVARWVRETTGVDDVLVQPNGVDVQRFRPAEARNDRPFTVGFVGTLKPWHGVDVLVHGFAAAHRMQRRNSRLLLVGDGPEADRLRQQWEALRIGDAVEAVGAVDPAQVPALLQRMDVAVAPYPADADCYFSPLKVYEYLASGLPVVASATGQLTSLLTEGHDGLLVPPGNAASIASALTGLADDPARRARLGHAARATAERHTWERVVENILTVAGVGGEVPVGV